MKKMYWYAGIAAVVVIAAVAAAIHFLEAKPLKSANEDDQNAPVGAPPEIVEYAPPQNDKAPVGLHTYTNERYGFSLQYPEDLQVMERSEAADGRTITFEDETGEKGFQIFITPYAEQQITKSRIDLDTHRSAEGTPVEVVLGGGVHALAFFSSDAILGRLREVWFLRGGYLYEATTYAELDSWLAGVMRSLQFE